MKLQVHSDVHIEFSDVTIPNLGADALILAGDIGTFGGQNDLRPWIKRHCDLFPVVMMIPGNHEYYYTPMETVEEILSELDARIDNFVYMQERTHVINKVSFAGATLWTDLKRGDPLVQRTAGIYMNDYHAIKLKGRHLTPEGSRLLHHNHLGFLIKKKWEYGNIDVVMTHHLPTMQSHDVGAHGDDELKWAYGSDADAVIETINPQVWIHGHTHLCKDYLHRPSGVRILSNARGYQARGYAEDTGWDPKLMIEVLPRNNNNKKDNEDNGKVKAIE